MQPITLSFAFSDPNEAAAFLVSVSNIGKAPAAEAPVPGNSAPATAAKPVASARSSRTAEVAPAAAPEQSTRPQESAAPTEVPAPAASASEPKKVAYADLQAAVLKLHKLDPLAAVPIAQGMGFQNYKSMPDDKWAEALEKVNAAIGEREVA